MPLVGGVAEGAEIRVVRRNNHRAATVCQQSVEFFHGSDDVAHVLDYMQRPNFAKRTIGEWKWELIKIGDDISLGFRVSVNTNGAGIFVDAAANIKNLHRSSLAGIPSNLHRICIRCQRMAEVSIDSISRYQGVFARHSSNVSSAKSA